MSQLLPTSVLKDFPILQQRVHDNKPLVYLDSAATSQKPTQVIEAISKYYLTNNANVHRGVHALGDASTKAFQQARDTIAQFVHAKPNELILTRNTTESLNGFVGMWAEQHVQAGDVIVTTLLEHHSNFIPWQQLAKRKGAEFRVIGVTKDGQLDLADARKKIQGKVKIVSVVQVSNAVGSINPIQQLAELAHKVKAVFIVDGAQFVPHAQPNFADSGIDVYAFSGHKMLGPMGIGGLVVREELLAECEPYLFGGGMIEEVAIEQSTFAELPDKFIAGTPDVASTVGLAAACAYLSKLGMKEVWQHDQALVAYALEKLGAIPQIEIVGPLSANQRSGSVTFLYNGVHSHDIAQILDSEGVAVRSGHHCTMPLHTHFGWQATTRASFNVYSRTEDIDVLVSALGKVKQVFGV